MKQNHNEHQHFWEVDLRILLLQWWEDISMFILTAFTFVILALPVIIPSLIMWYLLVNNFSFGQP